MKNFISKNLSVVFFLAVIAVFGMGQNVFASGYDELYKHISTSELEKALEENGAYEENELKCHGAITKDRHWVDFVAPISATYNFTISEIQSGNEIQVKIGTYGGTTTLTNEQNTGKANNGTDSNGGLVLEGSFKKDEHVMVCLEAVKYHVPEDNVKLKIEIKDNKEEINRLTNNQTDDGLYLYAGEDGEGCCFYVSPDDINNEEIALDSKKWKYIGNDNIESVKIVGDYFVKLYENSGTSGECTSIMGPTRSVYNQSIVNLKARELDNKVSSFKMGKSSHVRYTSIYGNGYEKKETVEKDSMDYGVRILEDSRVWSYVDENSVNIKNGRLGEANIDNLEVNGSKIYQLSISPGYEAVIYNQEDCGIGKTNVKSSRILGPIVITNNDDYYDEGKISYEGSDGTSDVVKLDEIKSIKVKKVPLADGIYCMADRYNSLSGSWEYFNETSENMVERDKWGVDKHINSIMVVGNYEVNLQYEDDRDGDGLSTTTTKFAKINCQAGQCIVITDFWRLFGNSAAGNVNVVSYLTGIIKGNSTTTSVSGSDNISSNDRAKYQKIYDISDYNIGTVVMTGFTEAEFAGKGKYFHLGETVNVEKKGIALEQLKSLEIAPNTKVTFFTEEDGAPGKEILNATQNNEILTIVGPAALPDTSIYFSGQDIKSFFIEYYPTQVEGVYLYNYKNLENKTMYKDTYSVGEVNYIPAKEEFLGKMIKDTEWRKYENDEVDAGFLGNGKTSSIDGKNLKSLEIKGYYFVKLFDESEKNSKTIIGPVTNYNIQNLEFEVSKILIKPLTQVDENKKSLEDVDGIVIYQYENYNEGISPAEDVWTHFSEEGEFNIDKTSYEIDTSKGALMSVKFSGSFRGNYTLELIPRSGYKVIITANANLKNIFPVNFKTLKTIKITKNNSVIDEYENPEYIELNENDTNVGVMEIIEGEAELAYRLPGTPKENGMETDYIKRTATGEPELETVPIITNQGRTIIPIAGLVEKMGGEAQAIYSITKDGRELTGVYVERDIGEVEEYTYNGENVGNIRRRVEFKINKMSLDNYNPDLEYTYTSQSRDVVITDTVIEWGEQISSKRYEDVLDVPAVIINSRTYIPVRYVLEELQADIRVGSEIRAGEPDRTEVTVQETVVTTVVAPEKQSVYDEYISKQNAAVAMEQEISYYLTEINKLVDGELDPDLKDDKVVEYQNLINKMNLEKEKLLEQIETLRAQLEGYITYKEEIQEKTELRMKIQILWKNY